ncbi:hypothetical protein D3C84_946130 [compost metagenome]
MRNRMPKASGSMVEYTPAWLGRCNSMRCPLRWFHSSTPWASNGIRSCGVSDNKPPPSALASCMSFSESRESSRNAFSIFCARTRNGPSGASWCNRWICARVEANGVRSSWALLAVKLRSASRALRKRSSRWLTASANGSISAGRRTTLIGDRSPTPRASIARR